MVPATGAAHLHHVYRKFLGGGVQPGDLVVGSRRTRYLPQLLAEDPGHEGDLLLSTDRAQRRRRTSVELRGTQQIRTRVADIGHGGPSGMDFGQPRPALQGVVDDLALHEFKGTWSPPELSV